MICITPQELLREEFDLHNKFSPTLIYTCLYKRIRYICCYYISTLFGIYYRVYNYWSSICCRACHVFTIYVIPLSASLCTSSSLDCLFLFSTRIIKLPIAFFLSWEFRSANLFDSNIIMLCPITSTRKKSFVKISGRCDAELVFILRKMSLYQSLNVN